MLKRLNRRQNPQVQLIIDVVGQAGLLILSHEEAELNQFIWLSPVSPKQGADIISSRRDSADPTGWFVMP